MIYVVIDHRHEPDAHLYRLTVGREVWDTPATDDPGDEAAAPVLVGHTDIRDFVFADNDERWADASPDSAAAMHRELVREALEGIAPDPVAPTPDGAQMPGIGDPL